MVWDDQKVGDYAYQTEFSYRMNQLSKRSWYARNIAGGIVLGILMAVIMFLVPDSYFSDPARMVIAVVVGVWPTKVVEKTAERTTKVAQVAMAVTFAIGIGLYALSLLLQG